MFSRPPLATLSLSFFLSSTLLSSSLRIVLTGADFCLRSIAAAAATSGAAMLVPDM